MFERNLFRNICPFLTASLLLGCAPKFNFSPQASSSSYSNLGPNALKLGSLSTSKVTPDGFTATVTYTDDANQNGSVRLYYCDASKAPGCNPMSGSSTLMARGPSVFVANVAYLTSPMDPGDTLNVQAVPTDADGTSGNPSSAVALVSTKMFYRSIGFGTTWPLASGSGNAMTISGEVATFASPLPDDVGVGDVLQYDHLGNGTIDSLGVISGRASSTQFYVKTPSDGTATATSTDYGWSIFRAYTSIANALSGTPNVGIAPGVVFSGKDYLNVSLPADITTGIQQGVWNFLLYADAVDTSGANFTSSWATSATDYLRLYAPHFSNEVGVSQRHSGIWDNSKATVHVTSASIVNINPSFVTVDGIQIDADGLAANNNGVQVDPAQTPSDIHISNNIIRNDSSHDLVNGIAESASSTDWIYCINNLIYGFFGGSGSYGFGTGGSSFVAYGNTSYGNYAGFTSWGGTSGNILIKDNIANNVNETYYESGSQWSPNNDYDLADDARSPGGIHSLINRSVSFVDAANNDLRPAITDSNALFNGPNLTTDSVYAYTSDIRSLVRTTGNWAIGTFNEGWAVLKDAADVAGQFASGAFTNTQWSTNEVTLAPATLAQRQLNVPDSQGFNTTSILGDWHFEEPTLNNGVLTADASGNGLAMTFQSDNDGSTNMSTSGKVGNGVELHRSGSLGDFFTITNTKFDDLAALSVSAWVNPASSGSAGWGAVAMKGRSGSYMDHGWGLYFDGSSYHRMMFDVNYSTTNLNVVSAPWIPMNQWTQVVVTWDGSNLASHVHIYVDGVEYPYVSQTDGVGTRVSDSGYPFSVGGMYNVNAAADANLWDGILDEVSVFSRVLTGTEAFSLYNRGNEEYPASGTFLSRVFDSTVAAPTWYSMGWVPRAPYGKAIRNIGDETLTYPEGVSGSSLVSYIPMDESSVNNSSPTNAVTDLKTGVRGVFTSTSGATNKSISGMFGDALNFSSADSDSLSLSNLGGQYTWAANLQRTWSMWVKPTSTACTHCEIYSQPAAANFGMVIEEMNNHQSDCTTAQVFSGMDFEIFTSGYVDQDDYCVDFSTLQPNQWNHIVVVYDGTQAAGSRATIYINGVQQSLTTYQAGTVDGTSMIDQGVNIGSYGATNYSDMAIDEVAVFNMNLSQQQVDNLYLRGVGAIKFQVRSCTDAACASNSGWVGPDGTSGTYFTDASFGGLGTPNFLFGGVVPANRYLQYQATISTTDQSISPALRSVSVDGYK